MSGEFHAGSETGEGRTSFFPGWMPAPTGVADGVGVGAAARQYVAAQPQPGHVAGAPTGMPVQSYGLPSAALTAAQLAGLPHFAGGGDLGPGGTGVVGEDGEELVHANPAGGVSVAPLALPGGHDSSSLAALTPGVVAAPRTAATSRTATSADLAGLPAPAGGYRRLSAWGEPASEPGPVPVAAPEGLDPYGAPAMPARLGRELGGYGLSGAPPEEHTAQDRYAATAQQLAALPPDPNAPQYHVPAWRRVLAGAAEIGTDLFAPRLAGLGAWAGHELGTTGQYRRDQQQYQRQQQQGYRQQAADQTADWRAQQAEQRAQQQQQQQAQYQQEVLGLRQQVASERQHPHSLTQGADGRLYSVDQATGAAVPVMSGGTALRGYREPRAAAARLDPVYTQQAVANALGSHGGRSGALAYVQQHGAELAAHGADIQSIYGAIDRRYPAAQQGGIFGAGAGAPAWLQGGANAGRGPGTGAAAGG